MNPIFEETKSNLLDDFNLRAKQKHAQVATAITTWLAESARKKPVPDLTSRIKEMVTHVQRMTPSLTFEFSPKMDRIVIKAANVSSDTLRALKYGTDWFDPHPDIDAAIIAAIHSEEK